MANNYATCWKCGHHPLRTLLKELTGVTPPRELFTESDYQPRKETPVGVYQPPISAELLTPHINYLKSRGFSPAKLERLWGITGVGPVGKYAWRIVIPVIKKGKAVTWTTRSLSNDSIRYLSSPPEKEQIPLKSTLYGLDYCRNSVIIHEGPTDVWATGPGSVCTFGLNYSRSQVLQLARVPVRVVCFDADSQSQRVANRLANELAAFPGQTSVVVLDAKDSAEASKQELKQLRRLFLD